MIKRNIWAYRISEFQRHGKANFEKRKCMQFSRRRKQLISPCNARLTQRMVFYQNTNNSFYYWGTMLNHIVLSPQINLAVRRLLQQQFSYPVKYLIGISKRMAPCCIMILSELNSNWLLTSKWMKPITERIQHFKTQRHEIYFLWDLTSLMCCHCQKCFPLLSGKE